MDYAHYIEKVLLKTLYKGECLKSEYTGYYC